MFLSNSVDMMKNLQKAQTTKMVKIEENYEGKFFIMSLEFEKNVSD